MCDFQKLSFNEHGYIVRCPECGHYQLGFGTTMLTLSDEDFATFCKVVAQRYLTVVENEWCAYEERKSVVLPTPFTGICLLVTENELAHLYRIIDNADNEIKALSMMELFNK